MPDGRLVRFVPQDGPPTEPGLYLAEYTPRVQLLGRDSPDAERHTIAREVRIDGAGCLDHGPDSARLEWWARIETIASGGSLIRGGAMDGEANDQRGEGAGSAEPSTPGREVASLMWASPEYMDKVLARARQCDALEAELTALADEIGARPHSSALAKVRKWVRVLITEAGGQYTDQDLLEAVAVVRRRLADLERALADEDGCRQLALGRALQAEARVAELEAAARWVPVSERLPDEGVEVLVSRVRLDGSRYMCPRKWQPARPSWVPYPEPAPLGVWVGGAWPSVGGGDHWRPLPAGPEVQP